MNLFPNNTLLIATHNSGKLDEFKYILKNLNLKIFSAKDLNLDEPIENKDTTNVEFRNPMFTPQS